MTWQATYTLRTYLASNDWLVGETNAGGGFAFQASVVIYKDNGGVYQCAGPLAVAGAAAGTTAAYVLGVGGAQLYVGLSGGTNNYFDGITHFRTATGAAGIVDFGATGLIPAADNNIDLGSGSLRYKTVYAATGTINTSDAREKELAGAIPDEWLDAWADVSWGRFKYRHAVADKGEAARWHIGAMAQQIRDAFDALGLDALAIGLLCFDKWESADPVDAVSDEAGNLVVPAQPSREAGERWGLRYDECFAMEAAYQRRRMAAIEARLVGLGG